MRGETRLFLEDLPVMTRLIMDALGLPADVPGTRFEQDRIEGALQGWFLSEHPGGQVAAASPARANPDDEVGGVV